MNLPFTVEEFLGVFRAYNGAIWPAQAVLLLIALAMVGVSMRRRERFDRFVVAGLALLWGWSGTVYHLVYFRAINGAALVFGMLFVINAIVLGRAVTREKLGFAFTNSVKGWAGAATMLYALVVYPLIGLFAGHVYPASPTFGAPCPLAIFTFGMLLWATRPLRWFEVAIPLTWSLIGTSAAMTLGMREDLGLAVAAILFMAVQWTKRDTPALVGSLTGAANPR